MPLSESGVDSTAPKTSGKGRQKRQGHPQDSRTPSDKVTPLLMKVHQYQVMLAVAGALVIGSIAMLSLGTSDPLALFAIPLSCGAVLSFATLLLSRRGERWQVTQALVFFSVDLVFLLAVLYFIHLTHVTLDPLETLAPWDYTLVFATISLPIIAIDLRQEVTRNTLIFRLGLTSLLALGIVPLGLLISPATHAVAAAMSLAAFLLLVDALLKVAAREGTVAVESGPLGSNPLTEWFNQTRREDRDQASVKAIFDAREERMSSHRDFFERAKAVTPEPMRTADRPGFAEPDLPLEGTKPPSEAIPLGPAAPAPAVEETSPASTEPKPAPVYFSAGSEVAGRLSTGIERLDMLLRGGIPLQSQTGIIGPIFIGKEVVLHTFIAAGLVQGEQALVIASARSPLEINRELAYYLPNLKDLQQKGALQWVDAFAGDTSKRSALPNVLGVAGPGDFDGILEAVAKVVAVFKGKPFRVAFISLSTSLTQAEERRAFDFLRSLQFVLREAGSTCVFAVDRGVMDERQLEELQSMLDGSMLFKRENDKNYLSVAGVGDVATRAWVEYQRTGKTLSMGSFALERIR